MKSFRFSGSIQSSKSVLNRAWLIKSYFPQFQIHGDSHCDDVNHMKLGLLHLAQKKEIDCGEAGTVLRFLALRASREAGSWTLKGSPRLLSRPHTDLSYILEQFGVRADISPDAIRILSHGWKKPMFPIRIHRDQSSQFASSLLLNSWNLDFPVEFEMKGGGVSESYWQMSLEMARNLGMSIDQQKDHFKIPGKQTINVFEVTAEIDYSSAFAICAAAALGGEAEILNCDPQTRQPDALFIEALKSLGVPVTQQGSKLTVRKAQQMKAIQLNLASAPDLFPVLSVLCAFAKGSSKLYGAPHLALKESNRITKTNELLRAMGAMTTQLGDGLEISGIPATWIPQAFTFDPDQDHRMAMAAGLLKLKDFPIKILHPEVVSKSFPEFWKILGVTS